MAIEFSQQELMDTKLNVGFANVNEVAAAVSQLSDAIDSLDVSISQETIADMLSDYAKLSDIIDSTADIGFLSGKHDSLSTDLSNTVNQICANISTDLSNEIEKNNIRYGYLSSEISSNDDDIKYLSDEISSNDNNYLKFNTRNNGNVTLSGNVNLTGAFNINPDNGIDGFYVGDKTIAEALNVDQVKAIIEDRYTTKFEVFAISGENLPAGTRSDVKVDIDAMFDGTNEYAKANAYDKDQIIINTTSSKKRIFKAKNNVPAGANADDNFENITSKYITEESGIQYHNYINGLVADTVQVLEIRASIATKDQNVVIYWGDGTSTKLTNAVDYTDKDNTISAVLGSSTDGSLDTIVSFKSDPTDYEGCWYCWHDYATDMKTKNVTKQKYTVTIVGSTCWGIKSAKKYKYGTNRVELSTAKQHNIISRLWDIDLPWSESLFNTSSLVVGSDRLLYVKVPAYFPVLFSMQNMSSTFKDCKNLQYMHGFSKYTWYNTVRAVGSTFSGCSNMIKSDFRIPHSIAVYTSPLTSIYSGCSSMAIDINSILPVNGFSTRSIPWGSSKDKDKNVISSPFKNCISLQCSDKEALGDILWNDTTKKWKSHSYLFSTCNKSLKDIVPDGWKNS